MSFRLKRVTVTGGEGFIGSNLVRRLVSEGASVTSVDSLAPSSGANPFNLEGIDRTVNRIRGSLTDPQVALDATTGADLIFNLAGLASHPDSMAQPLIDLDANLRAQETLLEACRRQEPRPKVVFTSTRQVYGPPRYLPVDERHPVDPPDVNAIHKLAAEHLHLMYRRVYDVPVVVLRLTNTYGPRQCIRHARLGFVGWFVNRVLLEQPIELYGGGGQIRDFTYVDDVVEALLAASEQPACDGRVFNVCGERASLRRVAEVLTTKERGTCELQEVPFPANRRAIDIGNYYGTDAAFQAVTNWRPQIGIEKGLEEMLNYFRLHRAHYLEVL